MMTDTDFNYERYFLKEGLDQFKDYLLSDEVYWALNLRAEQGTSPYPQLTLGNLLLSEARLQGAAAAMDLSPSQKKELDEINTGISEHKNEWQVAWSKKSEKEFGQRLRQWTNYLDDLGENPDRHRSIFATEVRTRAILELLKGDLPRESKSLLQELDALDQRLKRLTSAADFVWGNALKSAFPQEQYWFLYAKPN